MKSVEGFCLYIWAGLRSLLVNRAKKSMEDNCEYRVGESVASVDLISFSKSCCFCFSQLIATPTNRDDGYASFLSSKSCTNLSFSWIQLESIQGGMCRKHISSKLSFQ